MCNRYTIRGNAHDVADALRGSLLREFFWSEDILPRRTAPTMILGESRELGLGFTEIEPALLAEAL